ncbi:MAG: tRNA (adenosine(37)-N6)-dimethylallyltransferase MiaA [Ignavibacteriae bacterium HGW-Ignavibacteriae-4]|jgi:tRNA dimethylallyltransferase|nr:MAG: tRNA (adenosine(37)-N6)-dimethylallyltransferase MiaA [Ignavibacteriae bacterium HGW-Ignavibacteriae-4]
MSRKIILPKNSVIVITGPTASGKTSLSIELAHSLKSEIISADSRQVYKLMDICTAKPSQVELNTVKHHLIDFLDPNIEYSAGKFADDATKVIKKLYESDIIPIVCGGSAFYIKALFDGLFDEENKSKPEIRIKLNQELENFGIGYLQEQLEKVDYKSYTIIELDNPRRVIRALEYYYSTCEPISVAYEKRSTIKSEFQPIYFAIDYPREELYDRINQRCEQMWNNGLVNEYKSLISLGYDENLNSLNTVGYKESRDYLKGIYSKEEALEEFKKNTRRFAKRQLTWFRKNKDINWLEGKSESKLDQINDIIKA